jgi:putative MATE family efflux protein
MLKGAASGFRSSLPFPAACTTSEFNQTDGMSKDRKQITAMAGPPLGRLFSIASPLFLELALGIGTGLIGTSMAAHISDPTAAAYALANNVAAMLFILFRIVGAGVSVVVTQSLGSGRRDLADSIARAVLGAGTWVGGLTALVALAGAAPMLRLLNAPPEVMPLAVPFLMAIAPAILLDAWLASMSSITRAHFHARDALNITIITQVVSIGLAFPLMFGWVGMPPLGLIGYAIAIAVARVLALRLYLIIWRKRLGLVPALHDWWQLKSDELAAVLRIGLPGAAENIAYRLAFMFSIAAAGLLGTEALATQAYALQITYVALIFSLALGFAVEILVGHMIGAGHLHDAHLLVRRTMGWGFTISIVAATVSALLAPWTLRLFTDNPSIISTGMLLLWLSVIVEPGRAFNLIIINALRATGDARYPVVAGAASMIIVLGGGSWVLGVHAGLGLAGIWIAYAADEWIRGLLMWRRWQRHDWLPYARATRRRLRHGAAPQNAPLHGATPLPESGE